MLMEVHRLKERLNYLDGIRGIMAVNVIFNHFTVLFFPQLYYVSYGGWWARSPLAVLNNGNIAVQYFFVLSAFLLTLKLYQIKITIFDMIKGVIKRYFRLLPMVALATLFAYGLMKVGFMYHLALENYIGHYESISAYNNFVPSLKGVLYNSFFKTFVESNDYVGPFWTIKWEISGCVLLFILLLLKEKKILFYVMSMLAMCVFYFKAQNLISFVLGMLLAVCFLKRNKFVDDKFARNRLLRISVMLCSIYLMTAPQDWGGWAYLDEIYSWFSECLEGNWCLRWIVGSFSK